MNIAANADEREASPWHRKIPELKDILVGELAQRGDWVVANIETHSSWPVAPQKVTWRGCDFWIMPVMQDHYPAVAVKLLRGMTRAQCGELIMRFISNLSWVERAGIMVEGGIGGGNLPRPMGRNKEHGFVICDEFDLSYFPEPTDERALLALALMREGRGINHVGYRFLSFYRVLEVALPKAKHRIKWIERALPGLTGHGVKEALAELTAQGITNIGQHLYVSGRCAMAHASQHPIIDPDKPDDHRRLYSELPIMIALAQKAIEDVLGVETSTTVYRKHLYELAGFKKILGPGLVSMLTRGQQPTQERMVEVPDISVRIRRRAPYPPFEGMTIKSLGQDGTKCYMRFGSKSGDVFFCFALDFATERIEFSLWDGIAVIDTGTAESAERLCEVSRFHRDYFLNGQLHIVDADTGELIGRKDAFIPKNMMFNKKSSDAELAMWSTLAEERRERDKRFGAEMERNTRGYSIRLSG